MRMKFSFTCLLLSLLLLGFSTCKKTPNDGVPFYMSMANPRVVNPDDTSEAISDVWVEANSSNLGAYELPAFFPVLLEDQVSFTVTAGIYQTGQSQDRVPYPFYEPDTFTITAKRGEKYTHTPVFRYKNGTHITFNETFETSNDYDSLTYTTGSNVRFGAQCGVLTVNMADSDKIATQKYNNFTATAGDEVWLEVDYKSDVPFWVGLNGMYNNGSPTQVPVLFVLARNDWKKLYLKLTEVIGQTNANSYAVYFEAIKPVGSAGGSVYLDNIKLVHF